MKYKRTKEYCLKLQLGEPVDVQNTPIFVAEENIYSMSTITQTTRTAQRKAQLTYHKRNFMKVANTHFNKVFHTTRSSYDYILKAKKKEKKQEH